MRPVDLATQTHAVTTRRRYRIGCDGVPGNNSRKRTNSGFKL